jgi:hypothetical protein
MAIIYYSKIYKNKEASFSPLDLGDDAAAEKSFVVI